MSQRILDRTLLFNIIYIMRTFCEYRALDRQATISCQSPQYRGTHTHETADRRRNTAELSEIQQQYMESLGERLNKTREVSEVAVAAKRS